MAQHVGIVACSAPGAALCYRTLCTEAATLFGRHGHPEVSLHGFSLSEYVSCLEAGDWAAVGELMLASALRLAAAGADFLICPDNTIHAALPAIRTRSPLPWLDIGEVVARHAAREGLRCLGLTGTRWLVEGTVYPERLAAHGLDVRRPTPGECLEVDRIIMEELVQGVISPAARTTFCGVLEGLRDQGCDAVVLGCTELPLLVADGEMPVPTLDSTRLLAYAALERACA